MNANEQSLDIESLLLGYRTARFTPFDIIDMVLQRIETAPERHEWITRLNRDQLQPWLNRLKDADPNALPLYGIPFAIKDNIDLAGVPTTAGCADYAYTPQCSAFVVQQLIDAGAIPVGKTNLDQFATGLVGTRSPYGAGINSFDQDYISGGSSSGSAVSVATGHVSFSLGTDTAGSGRVPAAFNNLVGLKPTRGLLSNRGVVPACRSLDCVSIFALTIADANRVLEVCGEFDADDAFSRARPLDIPLFSPNKFRFGVPRADQLEYFGNVQARALFESTVDRLQQLGGEKTVINFEPFLQAARLLYEGPWVTERYLAIEDFIEAHADSMHPVTWKIISAGKHATAAQVFKAQYQLAACRRASEQVWTDIELMMTPTAGTVYTIEEVEQDPVQRNSDLGYYTNFMNLLDMAAVAVPAGFQENGLPFGVTLMAKAFADSSLAALADRLHRAADVTAGATGLPLPLSAQLSQQALQGCVPLAVCGAHLSGLPLNHQLVECGAWLIESTRTADHYKLYALAGGPPWRPGLVREAGAGSIDVEVWAMPQARLGGFLAQIPAPLGLGKLELEDGRRVTGFICEPCGIEGARDISDRGGWRAYLAESASS